MNAVEKIIAEAKAQLDTLGEVIEASRALIEEVAK